MAEGGSLFLDPYCHDGYHERSLPVSPEIDLPKVDPRHKDKKPSNNAKRGKQQKERRKMREKRRATGIHDVEKFSSSQADEDEEQEYSIDYVDNPESTQVLHIQSSSVDSGVGSSGNVDARTSRKVDRIRARRQQEEDANIIAYTPDHITDTTKERTYLRTEKRPSSRKISHLELTDPAPCEQCHRLFDKERREKRKSDRKLREADHTVEMLRQQVKDIEKDMEELEIENDELRQENELHQKTIAMVTNNNSMVR